MQTRINQTIVELVLGDITRQETDAIVNAANPSLLGGGGVDGAIHRAAGPALLAECRMLGGCKTGDAKITRGYRLKARHVIHTVGPVYSADKEAAPALLASAYRRSLEVAVGHGLTSIAFPSISTGAYGYPVAEAAPVALRTVMGFLETREHTLALVRFVLYDQQTMDAYAATFKSLAAERSA